MHDLWRGNYRKVMFTRRKTGDTIFLTVMSVFSVRRETCLSQV